ncbi:uncharacterized protein E0L32_008108 [Thyridium curvatum]|uniref:Aminodeoxychorismate synthase n=1 Tax=Thyridium curvatum TaxID=1093900 RepID=A0A507AM74_9PEZI|nr:uncharacterized protein E0L32_008108 [Thyridium curvatum]TPX10902.1 hypothetical protein E0L32_008108 [Thyridium curvatum]
MDVSDALRVEYHTGESFADVRVPSESAFYSPGAMERVGLPVGGSIWQLLAEFHEARRISGPDLPDLPFLGGFMGYITYEQGLAGIGVRLAEQHRGHRRPDVCLAWVTRSIVIDHVKGLLHVQELRPRPGKRQDWIESTVARLQASQMWKAAASPLPPLSNKFPGASIQTPAADEYEDKVKICQEFIAAGDSYELCLTDQTIITRCPRRRSPTTPTSVPNGSHRNSKAAAKPAADDSWDLYRTLRTKQPAPFASYIRLGPATLISSSPERFLQHDRAGLCSMKPMKGTVRKSGAVATLAQAEALLHVPKEEAENLMIVDLVRHDLHGVCGAGNVCVPHLLVVEEYQSVFTMITVVEGRLPEPEAEGEGEGAATRHTGLDVLAASLPPGSMTGAPKKRSCELLQEIEGRRERSLYSGVVGYMCVSGRGDWSVTIRSMFRWDDEGDDEGKEVWRVGAGGAVTILSTPEGEREEMFTKLGGPLSIFS